MTTKPRPYPLTERLTTSQRMQFLARLTGYAVALCGDGSLRLSDEPVRKER